MRLRVIQAGAPDVQIDIPGDTAIVGRNADCDVVVNEPFISKRHTRILQGVVVVDLNSSNGTLIDGHRIVEPTLLKKGLFTLGGDEVSVEVDMTGASKLAEVREALEEERRRGVILGQELEQERNQRASVEGAGGTQVERLLGENKDLKRRLEAAKRDLEQMEKEDAASVQSKLARERLQELRSKNDELQVKIDTAEANAKMATEASLALRRENTELRSRLEASEQPPQQPSVPASASELFVQLQSRNRELAGRVQELEAQLASKGGPSQAVSSPVPAPVAYSKDGGITDLLGSIATNDVDGMPALRTGFVDRFLVLESVRFLRQVEKVVTRMAGNFIQLYRLDTILPGVAGNVRALMEVVLQHPTELEPRDDFIRYLDELRRWMVVSFSADRKAATGFAAQICADLSEESLTASSPIPMMKKLAGAEAELWRRAAAYLKELSPDMVEDRLEKLARVAVQEMLDSGELP